MREGICSSALHCETSPGVLHPDGECSVQERRGTVGACSAEGLKNDPRDGTPPCEDRLREEEKAPGRTCEQPSVSKGELKERRGQTS